MKTLLQKAREDSFDDLDIFSTVNRLQEIAKEVKFADLVDLSSKQMGLVAELLWRVKRIKISPIDKNDLMGQA